MPKETSSTIGKILRATGHADRADFEAYRTREEVYETTKDPGCLKNLIDDRSLSGRIDVFRAELLNVMERTNDQELANYSEHLSSIRLANN